MQLNEAGYSYCISAHDWNTSFIFQSDPAVDNILFDGGEQMNFAQDLDSPFSTLLRHITGSSHTVVNYCPISVSTSRLHSGTGTKFHSPYHNCLAQMFAEWMNKWRKEPIDALTDRANLSLKCLPQLSPWLSPLPCTIPLLPQKPVRRFSSHHLSLQKHFW